MVKDTMVNSGVMKVIDVNEYVRNTKEKWVNYTLCPVNDCLVRMAVIEGDFHWHHHEKEDEFFFVVSGTLLLDVEEEIYELTPGQGFTVPRGIKHRTRAKEKTVILMVEGNTVNPNGD